MIAIIDPAVKVPETDCFNHLTELTSLQLSYHLPTLSGMGSLARYPLQILKGAIILGSASSVHDEFPWQSALTSWLKGAIDNNLPILGICFGHQLLGQLFDAKVQFIDPTKKEKQLGFREIQLEPNRLWGKQMLRGKIFTSHQEIIANPSNTLQTVGSNAKFTHEALAHPTKPIWSFQGHIEATPEFARRQGFLEPTHPQDFEFGYSILKRFFEWATKYTR